MGSTTLAVESQEAWGCFVFEAHQSFHPANSYSFLQGKTMANTESKTSQFIEITGLTKTEAVQFLEATDWVVDEALQLFFTVGGDGLRDALPPQNPGRSFESDYNEHIRASAFQAIYRDHLRESALRDDIAGVGPETFPPTSPGNSRFSRNEYADEEPVTPEGQVRPGRARFPGHSTRAELSRGRAQTIAPPFHLLSFGSFEAVKVRAQIKGKWILANVQTDESESHELNNVWRNSEIQDIIQKHFIFWQIYDDYEEGQKINHWYKIDKKPAVLVVDPHTGYKMDHVEGTVDTQQLIEILRPYTEKAPVAESSKYLEDSKNSSVVPREVGRNEYPALPREPARGTPGVVNIAIRLPYGSRIQRQFLATDPIQVLWSFAATEIPEDKDFVLVSPTRGLKLNFDDRKSIEEAGVADSVLTLFFRK